MNGHQRDYNIVEDFCDSKLAKSHPLFSHDSKALQILLCYDDVELCNPIGSNKTKHKIGNVSLNYYYLAPINYSAGLIPYSTKWWWGNFGSHISSTILVHTSSAILVNTS